MQSLSLGSLRVSALGLGCWTFGRQLSSAEVQRVVDAAIDAGITFFDTADRYGSGSAENYRFGPDVQEGKGKSEEFLGYALRGRRDRVVVSTKFGAGRGRGHRALGGERYNAGGGEPRYVRACVENSLRRLGTDYLDLVQLHEPDLETPIEDTLGALHELIDEGKVREIGCSNFDSRRLSAAAEAARASGGRAFVSVQNHYSVLFRQPEPELIRTCETLGTKLLPYFPLESGVLTGKYRTPQAVPSASRLSQLQAEGRPDKVDRFLNERTVRVVAALQDYAAAHGRTLLELALSWLLCQPMVGPLIPGASRPDQVQANAASCGWKLSATELREIDALCEIAAPAPLSSV